MSDTVEDDDGDLSDTVYRLAKNTRSSSSGWGFSNNTYGRAYHDDPNCYQLPSDKMPRPTTRGQAQRHMYPCAHCVTESVDQSPSGKSPCPICEEPVDQVSGHVREEHF